MIRIDRLPTKSPPPPVRAAATLLAMGCAALLIGVSVWPAGPVRESARADRSLLTAPARTACDESARVDVVEQQGFHFAWCPRSFSVVEARDGQRIFAFRGTEGEELVVEMAADATIERVQLGALRCLREACAGMATRSGADAGRESGRSFSFFGLTLKDAQYGGPTATLTGSVVVPPL